MPAMTADTAYSINVLGDFCGIRDVEALTADSLQSKYGIRQADVMVLFGGSILNGGDIFAHAIKNKIAKKYIISGGVGHTTDALRKKVHKEYPSIITDGLTEAEIFSRYLSSLYGVKADYLETKSTNCGNNITFLLDLFKEKGTAFRNIILCQDAAMQRRMEAGLRKYVSDDILIINYAAYKANVITDKNRLIYSSEIHGMWDIEKYISLLMGEIPRLSDNTEGYGPAGKNFIAHVDIPKEVEKAFERLKATYGDYIRKADPLYSSSR